MGVIFKIISSEDNWIDGEAVDQLCKTAALKGVQQVYGMPDLHVGIGYPVGCCIITENIIYPQLAGSDIGCGMSLFQTTLQKKKLKLERLLKKVHGLESCSFQNYKSFLDNHGVRHTDYDKHLGTVGGGNHFAEIQVVHEIFDSQALSALNLDPDLCQVLIHSGSRGYGKSILSKALELSTEGLAPKHSDKYFTEHDNALLWAQANRNIIAKRLSEQMNCKLELVLDVCHNWIEKRIIDGEINYIHRKGAAVADCGPIVIPGSRGTLTYLVEPTPKVGEIGWTLAHGAGRKWSRTQANDRLRRRYKVSELEQNRFKGRIICEDKKLIFEEAPDAYKDIEIIIRDLADKGYIKIIASFAPQLTYKTRSKCD